MALTENRRLRLRLAVRLELVQQALGLFLTLGESTGEPRNDEERDDAEHLQQRVEHALAPPHYLGDR